MSDGVYRLKEKRPVTLDNRDSSMVLLEVGNKIKIKGSDVLAQDANGKYHMTIEMVTPFLINQLELCEKEEK